MTDPRTSGSGGLSPSDVREPTPAERVRALPMVSVALGSLALGFCLVYFVCRPEGADRSGTSRPIATDAGAPQESAPTAGRSDDLRTDYDASSAPGPGPAVPPVAPVADAAASPPPPPPPAPVADADAGSASIFGSRLTLQKSEIRMCAGIDGVELPKERCGRVRGVELFMTRNEDAVKSCIEQSFPVGAERPRAVAVTLAVNFETKSMRISIPGADQARAAQYGALRACLEQGLGAPEYDRIEHPLNAYRFVFTYDYQP